MTEKPKYYPYVAAVRTGIDGRCPRREEGGLDCSFSDPADGPASLAKEFADPANGWIDAQTIGVPGGYQI